LKDYPGAIADYTKVLEKQPNLAPMYYNRALVRYQMKDKKEALADLEQAAQLFQKQGNQAAYQQVKGVISQWSK
jgi:tetratricopeptide (TPR) repeat protein